MSEKKTISWNIKVASENDNIFLIYAKVRKYIGRLRRGIFDKRMGEFLDEKDYEGGEEYFESRIFDHLNRLTSDEYSFGFNKENGDIGFWRNDMIAQEEEDDDILDDEEDEDLEDIDTDEKEEEDDDFEDDSFSDLESKDPLEGDDFDENPEEELSPPEVQADSAEPAKPEEQTVEQIISEVTKPVTPEIVTEEEIPEELKNVFK